MLVVVVIFIIFCCYCYCKKRHQDEANIGPVITTRYILNNTHHNLFYTDRHTMHGPVLIQFRYWDTNHPNDAGPGHVTSGGTLHSRNSWRDSLRSFTRGSLRRSFSLRRSAKRPTQEKQQQQPPNGLISTPI